MSETTEFKRGDSVAVGGNSYFAGQSGDVRWCEGGLVYVRLTRTRISRYGMAVNGETFIESFLPKDLKIITQRATYASRSG